MSLGRGLLAATSAILLAFTGCDDETVPAPERAPNLLVVMVDDQALSTYDRKAMPAVHDFFANGGTTFDEAIAAAPLCCPSRAGFLTGRYSHNHGVVDNTIGYRSLKGKNSTFPVALQAAGYRTALIGKFLNGYEGVGGISPAPGFDHWYAIHGYADYFNLEVSENGELATVPGYATESLTSEAIAFTRQAGTDETPFFLWLSYNAPHTITGGYKKPCNGESAQPANAMSFEPFANEGLPEPPSFNTSAIDGRPSLVGTDLLGAKKLAGTTRAWRCARAALAGVDEEFARLTTELREGGELENTVVVYLSDNGYYYGEHRLTADKRLPLEPALRIPMAIRVGSEVDDEPRPASSNKLVSQVDLAPTLLDFAGVDPCLGDDTCQPMDGRSLRELLAGGDTDWPAARAIPMMLDDGWTYEALRTEAYLYMEISASRQRTFATPQAELYDIRRDPEQLNDLAGGPGPATALELELARQLKVHLGCAETSGPNACR